DRVGGAGVSTRKRGESSSVVRMGTRFSPKTPAGTLAWGCQFIEHRGLLAAESGEAQPPEERSLAGNGEQFSDPAFLGALDATLDQPGGHPQILEIGM